MNDLFLNESSESMIQWLNHKDSTSFMNESAVWTNQLNEWFSDKISDIPPPTGGFSLIFKVSFLLFKSFNISTFKIVYLKH